MRRLSYSILASAVLLTNTSITSANEFNFDYFGKTSNTPSDVDRYKGYLHSLDNSLIESLRDCSLRSPYQLFV